MQLSSVFCSILALSGVFSGLAGSAAAATLTYTGNTYTTYVDSPKVAGSPEYETNLSIVLELRDKLAANVDFFSPDFWLDSNLLSWTVRSGANVLSSSDVFANAAIGIGTDGDGNVVQWSFYVAEKAYQDLKKKDASMVFSSSHDVMTGTGDMFSMQACGTMKSGSCFVPVSQSSSTKDSAGSWAYAEITPVPAPAAGLLLLSSGLAFGALRFARRARG